MKVLPDDIVLVLKGHKVYSSVSLATLGIWSDGEFGIFFEKFTRSPIIYSQMPASEQHMNVLRTVAWASLLARTLPPLKAKKAAKEAQTRIVSGKQRKIPSN